MNKHKCDKCDQPATNHSVEIRKGEKIEKHLCQKHADEEGISVKTTHTPINELLTSFVKLKSGSSAAIQDKSCPNCGLTFQQFRSNSLLGCPLCFDAFEELLNPILDAVQEGRSHHIGKTPKHIPSAHHQDSQAQVLGMRKRLAQAVADEDFELAATLRDQIEQLQERQP